MAMTMAAPSFIGGANGGGGTGAETPPSISGDEDLDLLLNILGALQDADVPAPGMPEHLEMVRKFREFIRTVGAKFLAVDCDRALPGLVRKASSALVLIGRAIEDLPAILFGDPKEFADGSADICQTDEPADAGAFADWLFMLLVGALADESKADLHEDTISVLCKIAVGSRDYCQTFGRMKRMFNSLVKWARETNLALIQATEHSLVLYSISLPPRQDVEALHLEDLDSGFSIKSAATALVFSGNILSLISRILPGLAQFTADGFQSISELLLETVVPHLGVAFPGADTGALGYLRLSAAFASVVSAPSIPCYIATEIVLKLWETVHDLAMASTEAASTTLERLQEEAAHAVKFTMLTFGDEKEHAVTTIDSVVEILRSAVFQDSFKDEVAKCSNRFQLVGVRAEAKPKASEGGTTQEEPAVGVQRRLDSSMERDSSESESGKRKASTPQQPRKRTKISQPLGEQGITSTSMALINEARLSMTQHVHKSTAKLLQALFWRIELSVNALEVDEVCRLWKTFVFDLISDIVTQSAETQVLDLPWPNLADSIRLLFTISETSLENSETLADALDVSILLLALPWWHSFASHSEISCVSVVLNLFSTIVPDDQHSSVVTSANMDRVSRLLSSAASVFFGTLCQAPRQLRPFFDDFRVVLLGRIQWQTLEPVLQQAVWKGLGSCLANGLPIPLSALDHTFRIPDSSSKEVLSVILDVAGLLLCLTSPNSTCPCCRESDKSMLPTNHVAVRSWLDSLMHQLVAFPYQLACGLEQVVDVLRRFTFHVVDSNMAALELADVVSKGVAPVFGTLDRTDHDYRSSAQILAVHPLADSSEFAWAQKLAFIDDLPLKGTANAALMRILVAGDMACVGERSVRDDILLTIFDDMSNFGYGYVLRQLAFEQIQRIARVNGLTSKAMLQPLLRQLSTTLVSHDANFENVISETADRLLNLKPQPFFEKTLCFTLPHLIVARNEVAIKKIAEVLNSDVATLCIQNAHHILAALFTRDDSAECVRYLCSLGPQNVMTRSSLIKSSSLDLITVLTFELGAHSETERQKVIRALEMVKQERPNRSNGPSQLSDFFKEHFLGILAHANAHIRNQAATATFRSGIVRSLAVVIRLMGPSCGLFMSQLIAAFQASFAVAELRDASLDGWHALLQTLEPATLGPQLDHIVLALTATQEGLSLTHVKRITFILRETFDKQGRALGAHLSDIIILPQEPFVDFLSQWAKGDEALPLVGLIKKLIAALRKESPLVVANALSRLKGLLRKNQDWISSAVLEETADDTLVNELVRTLMETCRRFREENLEITRIASECIGAVGAIDPSRLSVPPVEKSEISLDNFSNADEAMDFICRMIEKQLVPAFKASQDPRYQDPVAYAIQELLLHCGFNENTPRGTSVADARWRKFSKEVAELIQPLLTSRYVAVDLPKKTMPYPIFRSKPAFRDWSKAFALQLIGKVRGSGHAHQLFSVCASMVKNDVSGIATFLLPHLVLSIVHQGDAADKSDIIMEVTSILEEAAAVTSPPDGLRRMTQTVFALLDHVSTWVRIKVGRQHPVSRSAVAGPVVAADPELADVKAFLDAIKHSTMAKAAFNCQSYSRALKHVELHIREELKRKISEDRLAEWYSLQLRILSCLDEADAMEGIRSEKLRTPTLAQEVLLHETAGNWSAALACYEMLLRQDPNNLESQLGLLKCQRNLGQFESVLGHVNGSLAEHPEWSRSLNAQRIEAAWRLGNWDSLDKFLKEDYEERFEASIGHLLHSLTASDSRSFSDKLSQVKDRLANAFASSVAGSYAQSYEGALKLHMLEDLEQWNLLDVNAVNQDELKRDMATFDARVEITVPSQRVQEPLLDLRRALLGTEANKSQNSNPSVELVNLEAETGRLWLKSAKLARKTGYFQAAYSDLVHANTADRWFLHVEQSKLLWSQNDKHRAVVALRNWLELQKLTDPTNAPGPSTAATGSTATQQKAIDVTSQKFARAKAQLLLARWMEETNGGHTSSVVNQYLVAKGELKEWEKTHYLLGRYYLKLLETEKQKEAQRAKQQQSGQSSTGPQQDSSTWALYAVKFFGSALQHGSKYIYQTMPRMLTIWLELGNLCMPGAQTPDMSAKYDSFAKMTQFMTRMVNQKLAAFQFLASFSQILSQIGHKNNAVFDVLEQIMVSVLSCYPQQGLWQIIPISKSSNAIRKQRSENVLNKVKVRQSYIPGLSLDKQIEEFKRTTDDLLLLAKKDAKSIASFSMKKDFKNLSRLSNLSMIMPIQSLMTLTFPSTPSPAGTLYKPYQNNVITIRGFLDEIEVMSSLVRPKKITIEGSDGNQYPFLCKPQDDLRKDARMMELNALVNKLLKKDRQTRKRRLYVRTYFVAPLNEDSGMIEWVNKLAGYRNIIQALWGRDNRQIHGQQAKDTSKLLTDHDKKGDSKKVIELFQNLLKSYPAVFYQWFLESFPEPNAWLAARTAYIRTCATISMIGFVMGLGDRHGENILYDSTNGDTVHVDLNCLFEKGLTFDRPERVPFRLTHNMVDAFGSTGVEGMFRKCCEETMRVLRENRDSLMGVLESFTHDPLLEWKKGKVLPVDNTNELAVRTLTAIKSKLNGYIGTLSSNSHGPAQGLSVEAQVRELIHLATDPHNLGRMYIGWAAHV